MIARLFTVINIQWVDRVYAKDAANNVKRATSVP